MTIIIAAVIGVVGVVLAALIGAYFLVERRRIGWEVDHRHEYSSGEGDDLLLMVRRTAIREVDGGEDETSDYRPTNHASEYVINLRCSGNRDISDTMKFDVEFNADAKIVLTAIRERGLLDGRGAQWDPGESANTATIKVPFLNRGDHDQLLIQTVDDASEECDLRLHQRGVDLWRMDTRRKALRNAIVALGALATVGGTAGLIGYWVSGSLPEAVFVVALVPFALGQIAASTAGSLARWLNEVAG